MTKLSFCICTYKRDGVIETMESILRIEGIEDADAEIVVSDDDPETSAEAKVAAFAARSAIPINYVVSASQNVATARNTCLRAAKGQWIAFIDDDQLVDASWLRDMRHALQACPADVVKCSVVAIYPSEAPRWIIDGDPYSRDYGPTGSDLTTTSTCGVLMSRRLIDEMNLQFDAAFGKSGGEDVDFFRRAHRSGAKLISCREARVFEVVPAGRVTAAYLAKRFRAIGEVDGLSVRSNRNVNGRLKPTLKALVFVTIGPVYFLIAKMTSFRSYMQIKRACWAMGFFRGLLRGERKDKSTQPSWH